MSRFVDLDLNFTKNPITGDVSIFRDEQAVLASIKNIVFTAQGEKKFNPFFGGSLRSLLFEPIDPTTTLRIEDGLSRSIENFEPRARILSLVVTPQPSQNAYTVKLSFTLKNDPRPVTAVFKLERLR